MSFLKNIFIREKETLDKGLEKSKQISFQSLQRLLQESQS
jgi:hypothetical protein